MLPITVKLCAFLKSESANTKELLLLRVSGGNGFSATTINGYKVVLMDSILMNRDHPRLDKNKQSPLLQLSDD